MKLPLTPIRFLRYAQEQFPTKVGVVCGDERFTYAQFAGRAGRLAGALLSVGAKAGDRIAFLSTNCHRLLEAYYGVLEAGCVLLPLNVRLGPQELAFVLNDSAPRFLFVEKMFLPLVEGFIKSVLSVEACFLLDAEPQATWLHARNYEALLSASREFQRDFTSVDEDSLAELFYTSGTSDRPKGVMLTHRNVYLHALSMIAAEQASATTMGKTSCASVMLHSIPLFHANGWGSAHTITLLGGTHVLVHHFDPLETLRLIDRERVTSCAMVPTMLNALVNYPEKQRFNLSSLRTIMVGGAASSPLLVREVEQKLGCACISGYGLTETSPVLALSSMKPNVESNGEERFARHAMTGFAIPGVELRVVDDTGDDVPSDGVSMGEIIARGDAIMEGYWGRPEVSREIMRGGWFHTGDVATIDEYNYVHIVDRKKDIIVSGGENISSLEVEKILAVHPNVYEAIVIPVADEKWGEVPKAIVVLKPGVEVTARELIEFCRARLSHYKCPHSIEFVESLPKSGTGKIMKRELRKKYWSAQKSAAS